MSNHVLAAAIASLSLTGLSLTSAAARADDLAQDDLDAVDDLDAQDDLDAVDDLDAQDDPDDLDELDDLDDLDDDLAELDSVTNDGGFGLTTFKGFVATELRSFPLDRAEPGNDEQVLLETQVELDLRLAGGLSAFVRPWVMMDAADTDLRRYEPLEAYLTYRAATWDVTAGQMVESWGIADAFNPVDVLNRRDFAVDPFDPIVRGELGFRARYHFPGGRVFGQPSLAAYALPVFRQTPFPTSSSRYAFAPGGLPFDADSGSTPTGSDAAFVALRFGHTLSTDAFSADLQYVGARGPERTPTLQPVIVPSGLAIAPSYYGVWIGGGGFRAVPTAPWWSLLTLKAEVVYKRPYAFSDVPLVETPDDYLQLAVGFDRTINPAFDDRDQIILTVEYLGEHGADDPTTVLRPFDHDAVIRAFWELGDLARTSLELRAIVDVVHGERIAEAVFSRQLRFIHDDLQLEVRGRYVAADSAGGSFIGLFPNPSMLASRLQLDF